MLIAEAVLLLALDDDKGKLDSGVWMQIDSTLGGALLVDLALRGKVDITGDAEPGLAPNGDQVKAGRVVVRDAVPTGDPDLDVVLERLIKVDGKKPAAAVPVAAKGARAALTQRLVAAGVLSENKEKVLGIFPRTSWPAAQNGPEADLRARITAVLDQGAAPDPFTGCVIALLKSAQILAVVFPTKDKAQRKSRDARAEQLSSAKLAGQWAVGATGAAVQATMAAMAATAAITASVAATTAISAG